MPDKEMRWPAGYMNAADQIARALATDLSPGSHYCARCGRVTVWGWLRSKRAQRCEGGCGARFPCLGRCEHPDCQSARTAGLK